MSTISEIVEKIRTAVYAKNVREAIASGIESANNTATKAELTANEAKQIGVVAQMLMSAADYEVTTTASPIPFQQTQFATTDSDVFAYVYPGIIAVKKSGKYLVSCEVTKTGGVGLEINGMYSSYDEEGYELHITPTLIDIQLDGGSSKSIALTAKTYTEGIVTGAKLIVQKVG